MCEMPSSLSEVKFFETWKGPSRSPGRISWHWCRMSYLRLDKPSATDLRRIQGWQDAPPLDIPGSLYQLVEFLRVGCGHEGVLGV